MRDDHLQAFFSSVLSTKNVRLAMVKMCAQPHNPSSPSHYLVTKLLGGKIAVDGRQKVSHKEPHSTAIVLACGQVARGVEAGLGMVRAQTHTNVMMVTHLLVLTGSTRCSSQI